MAEETTMDLDMSLEDRINLRKTTNRVNRRGRTTGALNSGRIPFSARNAQGKSSRSTPYERSPRSAAPEGRWGHGGYLEQNKIKGGALAARLLSDRPPGGFKDDVREEDPASLGRWTHDKFPGGAARGRRRGPDVPSALAQKSLAALTGGQTDAAPTPSPILSFSVKGASGATVEVRNLVPGTTADDVAAIFGDNGTILSAVEVAGKANSVAVQVKFSSLSEANNAVKKFHGQEADGRLLEVVTLDNTLLKKAIASGVATPRETFDLLPEPSSGGMRSDALMTDPRAQVQTTPPAISTGKQRGKGFR